MRWFILIICVLQISCNKSIDTKIHPISNAFEYVEETSFLFTKQAEKDLFINLGIDKKIIEVGSLYNNTDQIFSAIQSVTIKNNKLIILDRQGLKISVFDLNGDLVGSTSSKGRGPGDMLSPRQIINIDNVVFLLDSDELKVLQTNEDVNLDSFAKIDRKFPRSFCSRGDEIFFGFVTNNKRVHSFSFINEELNFANDQINASYFDVYPKGSQMIVDYLSDGLFNCDDKQIVSVMHISPFVSVYDFRSMEYYNVKIPDFKPLKFKEMDDGGMVSRWDTSDILYHDYISINFVNDYILIQLREMLSEFKENEFNLKENELLTYVINTSNNEVQMYTKLSKVIYANSDYIVFDNDKSFPGLVVYSLK